MAAVDMRRVKFWLPPDYRPITQCTASQKYHHVSAFATTNSKNQAVPLYNKAGSKLKHSGKSKSVVAAPQEHECSTHSKGDKVKAQGTCETEYYLGKPI
jgi:hypothetical protein